MATEETKAVTPLEGKTTVDAAMRFEPERLSYACVDEIADTLARDLNARVLGKVVVVAGTDLFTDLANLSAVTLTLKSLARDYAMLEARSSTPAEAAADAALATAATTPLVAGLQTALGIVSLLREDVEYKGVNVTTDALSFELAVGSRLKKGGASRVLLPDFALLPALAGPGSLSDSLEELQQARTRAWGTIGPLVAELNRLDTELDRAARAKDQARVDDLGSRIADLRRDLDPVAEPLGRTDQRADELRARLDRVDEKTGLTWMARLLRAEAIQAAQPTYLHVKVVASGGHHRTSRSLLRMIFVGDGLSAMGGVVARWALLEKDGALVDGGISSARRGAAFPSSWLLPDVR